MDLPVIAIPLVYVLGLVGALVIVVFAFMLYYMDIRRYNPEGKVFIKARKKGLPVLCRQDIGSGYAKVLLGKKDKPDDIAFDDGDLPGLMVDASILGESDAMHFERGLDMYFYASTQWMPLTTINALGMKTVKRLAQERYKDLLFLPDQEIAELVYTKSQELVPDCDTVVKRYSPICVDPETGNPIYENGKTVPMSGNDLAAAIAEFREELKQTPIDTGLFSFQAAFLMNPISHLSQDLEQLRMLIELMLRAEYEKITKWMQYILMGLIVIGGITVCVVALFQMAK